MQFSLNEKQQEAVKHRGGPLLIIAGAGTGKTAVITQRIIDLINSGDAKSSEILALTFTEKAAAEMIERVDLEMPIGYEEIMISTFHSFCDQMLRQDGAYLGIDTAYDLMNQAQSYILFRENLFEFSLDQLRPIGNPTQNISSILRHFSRLQDEDVTPEEYLKFAKALPSKNEEEESYKIISTELAETFDQYTKLKIERSKLDFGDLINQSLRLLRERPTVLSKYQKRFKYILVDEYQDTNYTQNVLVNVLALGKDYEKAAKKDRSKAEITVVGDDDQAIYKFRGAAISNILHFKKVYPTAKRIVLTENYRSRQGILDNAYQLIRHNDPDRLEVTEGVDKKLTSRVVENKDENFLKLLIADNGTQEADLVAKQILKLTGNLDRLKDDHTILNKQFDQEGQSMFLDIDKNSGDYTFKDISILVRAHAHSDEFVQVLKHYGIPFKFGGARGLYTRPEISFLISFLRVLADYEDDKSMFNLLKNSIWDLSPRETVEILRLARDEKVSIFEFLENSFNLKIGEISDSDYSINEIPNFVKQSISDNSLEKIYKLLRIFDKAIKDIKGTASIGEILFDFFKESGYMEFLLENEDSQTQFMVQNISKYFEMIKQFEQSNPESSVFEYVDYLNYSIDIGESPTVESDLLEEYDAVNIMTVHGAKGLEFPVVFLVNLVSERFPTRNISDKFPIPDELIKDVIAEVDSRTEHLREERRLFYVGATRAKEKLLLTASRYYGEGKRMKKPSIFLDELLDRKVVEDFTERSGSGEENKFAMKVSSFDDSLELTEVEGIDPIYISYSHIDTYQTCPKRYKYKYALRVPSKPSSALAFGRTIHNTLQDFYTLQKNFNDGLKGFNNPPSLDLLLELYDKKWISEGFESRRHEQIRKDHGRDILSEFYKDQYDESQKPLQLEYRFKYKVEDVIIKGSIDRIDILSEGDEPQYELIDYKTGKAHDKKEVEDDLQLAIYSLVASDSLGLKIAKASLLYVEHGVKISVDITEDKRSSVVEEISAVMEDIRSRDFTPTPGYHCNFCEYRDICEDAQLR